MEGGGVEEMRWSREGDGRETLTLTKKTKKIVLYLMRKTQGGGEQKGVGRGITGQGTPKGEIWVSGARLGITPSKYVFSLMVYQLGEENCILCVSNYPH